MVATLADEGLSVCFANPGTTEMRLLAALGCEQRIKTVLGLHENVCSGAADGYARMTRTAAATLLHLGPGLSNALANLHNAKRARSPVLNIVGDHASYHRGNDPPLASDIHAISGAVSGWTRTSASADALAIDAAEALEFTRDGSDRIATLIVPDDFTWANEVGGNPAPKQPRHRRPPSNGSAVSRAAALIRSGKRCALLLDGDALSRDGLRIAARVRARFGVRLIAAPFPARLHRGIDAPPVERLAYFPHHVEAQLAPLDALILVGASDPVAFFAYPEKSTRYAPQLERLTLAPPGMAVVETLTALSEELGALADEPFVIHAPTPRSTKFGAGAIAASLAALLPAEAIVSDEGVTASAASFAACATAAPHDWLTLCGGAIGQGPPLATGAAIACPERRVIALQADGSALYTAQALWTQAREHLNVVTIIISNRRYGILRLEAESAGLSLNDAMAAATSLDNPAIDWPALAQGFGVPAQRATTTSEFHHALQQALASDGPRLVEAVVET